MYAVRLHDIKPVIVQVSTTFALTICVYALLKIYVYTHIHTYASVNSLHIYIVTNFSKLPYIIIYVCSIVHSHIYSIKVEYEYTN